MYSVVRRVARRLMRESRDLLEFVLLPGLSAVMPWPLCFRVFKLLSRWRGLYREDSDAALLQALARGQCADPRAWARQRRLVTLVDHADHFLFRTRSDAWIQRYVDVQGDWVGQNRAGMLWTFHWGAGLWALRHARLSGMQPHMVLAPPSGADFIGRWIFGRYVRARMRSVHRALEQPVIFAPGGMAGVRRALENRQQTIAVMDVPQDQVKFTRVTEILQQAVSVPAVLPRLAVDQGIPVTVFSMGIDLRNGRRTLHVVALGVHHDPQALTDRAFGYFDVLLRTAPCAWHLWAQAPRFFKARGADNTHVSDSGFSGVQNTKS